MSESQLVHVTSDEITEHSSDPLTVPEQSMHELGTTAEDDSSTTDDNSNSASFTATNQPISCLPSALHTSPTYFKCVPAPNNNNIQTAKHRSNNKRTHNDSLDPSDMISKHCAHRCQLASVLRTQH
ncbi:hypothetical protein WUBG_04413, partial [Wuchereria bancrofti]